MRQITPCPGKPLLLGRLGENEATAVRFDIAGILEEYGEAEFTLVYEQPGTDEGYPVTGAYPNYEEGYLEWIVTDTDLSAEGRGRAQLIAESGGTIVKTEIYMTMVLPALDGAGDPPSPWDSWQEAFGTMASETRNAARMAAAQAQIAWEDAKIATEAKEDALAAQQAAEAERVSAAEQAAIAKTNAASNSATYEDADGFITYVQAAEVHTTDSAGTSRTFYGHAKGYREEAKHEAELARSSAQAAAQAAARYPKIEDGTWRIWNGQAYVDTGIPASGVEIVRVVSA